MAVEIAEAVVGALRGELASTAVNAPMVSAEVLTELAPYVELVARLGARPHAPDPTHHRPRVSAVSFVFSLHAIFEHPGKRARVPIRWETALGGSRGRGSKGRTEGGEARERALRLGRGEQRKGEKRAGCPAPFVGRAARREPSPSPAPLEQKQIVKSEEGPLSGAPSEGVVGRRFEEGSSGKGFDSGPGESPLPPPPRWEAGKVGHRKTRTKLSRNARGRREGAGASCIRRSARAVNLKNPRRAAHNDLLSRARLYIDNSSISRNEYIHYKLLLLFSSPPLGVRPAAHLAGHTSRVAPNLGRSSQKAFSGNAPGPAGCRRTAEASP